MAEVPVEARRRKSIFSTKNKDSDKKKCTTCKKSKKVEHIVVYLPANYPSCPPGLEKLIPVDHLFVRQGIRETDPPFTMISKNKFEVLDGHGRRIFMARDSNQNILKLCCRGGCGQPFRMSIKEKLSGYEILAVNSRPDCYGAMSASISQNGMNLGFLSEDIRCCSSNYVVIDAQGNEIFRIYDASLKSPYSKGSYKRQEMLRQAEARREQQQLKDEELKQRLKLMRRPTPKHRHRHRPLSQQMQLQLQDHAQHQDVDDIGTKLEHDHSTNVDVEETIIMTTNNGNDDTVLASTSERRREGNGSKTDLKDQSDVVNVDVDVNSEYGYRNKNPARKPEYDNNKDECQCEIEQEIEHHEKEEGNNDAITFTPGSKPQNDDDDDGNANVEMRRRPKKVAFSNPRRNNDDEDEPGRDFSQISAIPFDAMSIEELDTERNDCICGCFCKKVSNLLASCCTLGKRRCRCRLGLGSCVGRCLDSCISVISGGAEFAVYSCQLGVVVGKMGKQWEELYDHYFNLQECFGASFPRDLSVRHKALLLGALFLLDFNHFQL